MTRLTTMAAMPTSTALAIRDDSMSAIGVRLWRLFLRLGVATAEDIPELHRLLRRKHRPRFATMSAMGQKQTSRHVRVMSVLPLKADIHKRGLHLRLAPKADIQAAGIKHVQAVSYLLDREGVNGGTRAKSAFSIISSAPVSRGPR